MSESYSTYSLQPPASSMNQNDLSDSEKTSIQVTVRVRPLNDKEQQENDISCVKVDPNYPNSINLQTNSFESKMFCFDYIAHQFTSQQEVFNKVALPAADSCLEGYNGCIFAYGQTGAGKTYTITGSSNIESVLNTEHRGMLPRVLEYIFQKIKQQQSLSVEYLVKCSYLEIYNEHIIDLLTDNGFNLQLREDLKKGVYVEGLTEYVTQNFIQAIEILKTGGGNRHNGATSMNRESSRSHSVFSIILQSKTQSEGVTHIKYSRFHFVDLAGSERTKQTNAMGDRLKEGCNINKSLSILGNVINALVEVDNGRARHIHYRDSKLTFFLKDSLGGNSKTRVIANISPASSAFQETLSTLKFAKRAKLIKNKVQINEDHSGNVDALNNEIKKLRLENLQFREMMQKGGAPSFLSGMMSQTSSPTNRGGGDFTKANQRLMKEENFRMQETEELCQHYLEQAQEIELKMNYNMGKTKDQLIHLMKYVDKFQQNEFQYRSIIKLQRAKIERMEQMVKNKSLTKEQIQEYFNEDKVQTQKELNNLKELLDNQLYCTKLLSENVDLQQQVEKIQEPGRSIFQQLTNNVDVLKNIQNKLEHNIEQRVRLQKVIEDIDEAKKNSSPDRSKKLEYQLLQIEKDHKQNVDSLHQEILVQKQRFNEQERTMEELVEENNRMTRELDQLKNMQEFKQAQHEETVHQLKRLVAEKNNISDEKNSEMHLINIDLTEKIKQLQQSNLILNERCKECDKQRVEMGEEKKTAHEKYLKCLEKYNEETTLLQASIHQLTSNFNEKEFENLRIKEESAQYLDRISELESKVNEAKKSQETLQQAIDDKSSQIENLEEQIIELEQVDNERNELQEELETLTETLTFRENELEEMKKQKGQLQTQLTELQMAKEQVEQQLLVLKKRIEELESQSSSQDNNIIEQKVEEIKKLEEEKMTIEEKLNEIQQEKESMSFAFEEEIKILQEKLSAEQEKLSSELQKRTNEEEKISSIVAEKESEVEELQIQIEEVTQKFETTIQSYKEEVIKLEEQLVKEKLQIEEQTQIEKVQLEEQIKMLEEQVKIERIQLEEQLKQNTIQLQEQVRIEKINFEEKLKTDKIQIEEQLKMEKQVFEEQANQEKIQIEEEFKIEITEIVEQAKKEKQETILQCKKDLQEQSLQMQETFREELERQIEVREKKIAKLEEENKKIVEASTITSQKEVAQLKMEFEEEQDNIISQKQEEINLIKEQMTENENRMEEEKTQLVLQIQQNQDEIQMHKNSIQAYEQQIQELENTVIDKETIISEKNITFKEQSTKVRHLDSEVQSLTEELNHQNEKVISLSESLQGQTLAYSKAKQEVEKLQQEIFSQQEKILEQEATIKKLREKQMQEANQQERQSLQLEEKVRQLEEDNCNMVKLSNQMQEEYEEKVSERDIRITEVIEEKKRILDQKIHEIEEIVRLQQQERDIALQQQDLLFNERLNEMKNQLKQVRNEKENIVAEYEQINSEKDSQIELQQQKIEEQGESIDVKNEEIDSLNQEVVHLRQKISLKEKEKQQYQERQNNEKQELADKYIEERESLQISLEQRFTAKQQQLEEQINHHQNQLEIANEEHSSQIEQKLMIIEEHQNIIDELNHKIEELQNTRYEQLSSTEQQFQEQKAENRLLIKQIENLKKEVVNKSEELAAEREDIEELQKEHVIKIKQIEEKHSQEIKKVEIKARDQAVAAENHWEQLSKKIEEKVQMKENELNQIKCKYEELEEELLKERETFVQEKNSLIQNIQNLEKTHSAQLQQMNEVNEQLAQEADYKKQIYHKEQRKLEIEIQQLNELLEKSNINNEEERAKFLQKCANMLKESEQNTQKQVILCEALRDEKWRAEKEEILRCHQLNVSSKENELFEKNQELLEMKSQLEEFKALAYNYEVKQNQIQESNQKQSYLNSQILTKQNDLFNSEKTSLKQTIESLNHKIGEKAEECSKLTIQNGEYISKIQQLEQHSNELEAKVSQITKNIQQQDTYIQKTAQELQQKKDIIQTINEEYSKVIQQNESLKHQISEVTIKLEKQASQQKQKEMERLELFHKSQLEELENKHNEELNKIFDERRIMLEQLEEQKLQKDNEIEELCQKYAEEIDNFKKLTKNLQNQNEFLEKDNIEKEELCNQLSCALNEFKQELNKREELLYLQDEQEKLIEVNKILEMDLEKKTKMIEESKANLIQAKRDMQEMKKILDQKNKEIESQKNELKEFYEKTQKFAQTRDKDVKEVKDQYCKLLDEHNKIMSQFNEQSEKMDKLKVEISDYAKEKALINQEIRKLQSQDKKQKLQINDMIEVNKRLLEEKNLLQDDADNLQKEIAYMGGHNNPEQKIKLFNKIKEENTLLKNEKKEMSTQLSQLSEDNKQLMKQIEQLRSNPVNNPQKSIANFRQNSSSDNISKQEIEQQINENKKLQDIIIQTNNIIQMGFSSKGQKLQSKSSIDKDLITGVKQIVQEILEKENKIKDLNRELDTRTIKYTELEKKYLQLQLNIKDSPHLSNMSRERSKDRFGGGGNGSNTSLQQQGPMSSYNLNQLNNNVSNQNFSMQQQPSYSSYLQNPIKTNQFGNLNLNANSSSINQDLEGNNNPHINNENSRFTNRVGSQDKTGSRAFGLPPGSSTNQLNSGNVNSRYTQNMGSYERNSIKKNLQ